MDLQGLDAMNIKPYFVEDLTAQLRSTYFATVKTSGLAGARVIFILCLAWEIKPDFIIPEHLQMLQQEMKG